VKSIDKEIFEVENRLQLHQAVIRQTVSAARQRTVQTLKSPVMLVGAVALGFLVAGGAGRRRAKGPMLSRRSRDKEQAKGFALGGLLMTAATWFLRSQFGGPVGLAHAVLSRIKNKKTSGTAPPAFH